MWAISTLRQSPPAHIIRDEWLTALLSVYIKSGSFPRDTTAIKPVRWRCAFHAAIAAVSRQSIEPLSCHPCDSPHSDRSPSIRGPKGVLPEYLENFPLNNIKLLTYSWFNDKDLVSALTTQVTNVADTLFILY